MFKQLSAITIVVAAALAPVASQAQIGISVNIAPPAIPVYVQPEIPGPNYIWTPGYWAWGGEDYYWVPGTWAQAPQTGYLWTPGYWGWGGSAFLFHEGYWGPHIGFYGGIDYGFGYVGVGYRGGYWENGNFAYNRYVNNVNPSIVHNVYNETVVNNVNVTRTSYNGGTGGVTAQPTEAERQAASFPHAPPTAAQVQHVTAAKANPQQYAAANHGAPAVAATARPGSFSGAGVVRATNAPASTVGRAEARPGAPAVAHPPATAVQNAARANTRAVTPTAEHAAARPEPTTPRPAATAPRPAVTAPRPAVAAPRPAPAAAPRPVEAAAPRPPVQAPPAAPRAAPPAPHPAPAEHGGGEKRER